MSSRPPEPSSPASHVRAAEFRARMEAEFAAQRPEDLEPEVSGPSVVLPGSEGLAACVLGQREALHAPDVQGSGITLAQLETALVDAAIAEVFERAWLAVGACELHCASRAECKVSACAAGSYGRCELAPYSDIDLIVLAPAEGERGGCDQFVRLVYHGVFDVLNGGLGLEVGYSCRSPESPGELDHLTQTSLLDLRRVVGPRGYVDGFEQVLLEAMDRPAFLLALAAEREAGHLTYAPEICRVEPDLKRGPGSLRDWLSAISHARAAHALRGPDPLSQLFSRSALYARELEEALSALSHLLAVRRALHIAAGRKTDVLYRSLQEDVAELLGYQGLPGLPATDQLLRDHYRAARALHYYAEALCRRSHQASVPASHGFVVCSREIQHRHLVEVVSSPELSVNAVALSARYRVPLGGDLADAIRLSAERVEPAQAPSSSAAAVVQILSPDGQPAVALRCLRDLGLLGQLVPELGRCQDRIPGDPTHDYEIMEHSLRACESIAELAGPRDPSLSSLAKVYDSLSTGAKRALLFAALMHDAGKATSTGDHSTSGAIIVRNVGHRLGLPEAETERAARLIEVHLIMAQTSRLKPLHEPSTILEFREVVRDAETLDQLYLLTYADTKSVGRGVFRDIEGRLLEELYVKTLAALADGMEPADLEEAARVIADRAVREIRFRDMDSDRIRLHLDEMSPAYVVGTPLEAIAAHIAMVRDLRKDRRPVIDFYSPRDATYTELNICTYDEPEPGLFSKICGALLANNIDIHSAAIHTSRGAEPIALDTLLIDRNAEPISDEVASRTESDLRAVLAGEADVVELFRSRGRSPRGGVELIGLEVQNDVAEGFSVIEIKAPDTQGLLYRFCRAIADCGLHLHAAQVTTWGGNAVDAFYVTLQTNRPVADDDVASTNARLRRILEKPMAQP